MILSSGDPDMYDGVLFSYKGDFLDYRGLEGMGVITVFKPMIRVRRKASLRKSGILVRHCLEKGTDRWHMNSMAGKTPR